MKRNPAWGAGPEGMVANRSDDTIRNSDPPPGHQRTPPPMDFFRARAEARAALYAAGELDLIESVDQLQSDAVEAGLVDAHGQDGIQAIIAEAFSAVRGEPVLTKINSVSPAINVQSEDFTFDVAAVLCAVAALAEHGIAGTLTVAIKSAWAREHAHLFTFPPAWECADHIEHVSAYSGTIEQTIMNVLGIERVKAGLAQQRHGAAA
jgi:hypothetical protein